MPERTAQLLKRQSAYQVNEIMIPELTKESRKIAFSKLLSERGFKGGDDELQAISQRIADSPASATPMYLYLASYDVAQSNDPETTAARLPGNMSDLVIDMMTRIERECDGGTGAVQVPEDA